MTVSPPTSFPFPQSAASAVSSSNAPAAAVKGSKAASTHDATSVSTFRGLLHLLEDEDSQTAEDSKTSDVGSAPTAPITVDITGPSQRPLPFPLHLEIPREQLPAEDTSSLTPAYDASHSSSQFVSWDEPVDSKSQSQARSTTLFTDSSRLFQDIENDMPGSRKKPSESSTAASDLLPQQIANVSGSMEATPQVTTQPEKAVDISTSSISPAAKPDQAAASSEQLLPPTGGLPPAWRISSDRPSYGKIAFTAKLTPNAFPKQMKTETAAQEKSSSSAPQEPIVTPEISENIPDPQTDSSHKEAIQKSEQEHASFKPTETGQADLKEKQPEQKSTSFSEQTTAVPMVAAETSPLSTTATSQTHSAEKQPTSSTAPVAELEAPPEPQTQPVHTLSFRLDSDTQNRVEVKVAERGGEVHVAVRSTDPTLTASLQQGIGELTGKLESHGYRTETWQPSHNSTATLSTLPSTDTQSNNQQYTDSDSQGRNRREQQDAPFRQRKTKSSDWAKEIHSHFGSLSSTTTRTTL